MRHLDPEAVQAFVLVADLGGFTRAGLAMGIPQSAVSVKIKRLEERLDRRLIERTPRSVRLSPAGEAFLGPARALLAAHDQAVTVGALERRRFSIGIGEHLVGPDLPILLRHMARREPGLALEIRVNASSDLLAEFDAGALDAVIALRHGGGRRDGESLGLEPFGWWAARGFERADGAPLPLATQAAPCGVRDMAVTALEGAGIAWTEAFVGGGVGTLAAAAAAGIAVAALARRVVPSELEEVGARLGLPPLAPREVVLRARAGETATRSAIRSLAAGLTSKG